MSRNITIKEIAEMAGVSVSAVSIVLNDRKGVSETTRKRILDIIQENHYTPNVNSRRLILQRSFNILIAIDLKNSPLNNFFYSAVINYIVEYASKLGYNIVLTTFADSFRDSRLEATLMQNNADGIIFLHDISSELQFEIHKTGIPFVVVDSQKNDPPYPCVQGNYVLSAYCATRHLIEHGHQKIAFLGSNRIPDFYISTFEGYKKAMTEFDLQIRPDWIQADAVDECTAKTCMENILNSTQTPTSAFCAGDLYAISAMNYLQENGYRLPDDFSICSIDDITMARYHYPPLTTIRIDDRAMGELAVDMLDKLINHVDVEPHLYVRSDHLIVRNSVKKIQ